MALTLITPAHERAPAFPEGSLRFQEANYRYELHRKGRSLRYVVSEKNAVVEIESPFVFGSGTAGQTLLYRLDEQYYESRVSYYTEIAGLDLTIGHEPRADSFKEALGRRLSKKDVVGCFGCHATAAVDGTELSLSTLKAGITCEGCHGAGSTHLDAITRGSPDSSLYNPKRWISDEVVDFCGSCHGTWLHVQRAGLHGVTTVRFQPYRLRMSACYDPNDPRISCTACHDPHGTRQEQTSFYDDRCLSCHVANRNSSSQVASCPVEKERCSSCHMPRYTIPGSHFQFSDHYIRIVQEGEAFPD